MERKNAYIEFRVYLQPVVDPKTAFMAAGEIQDKISDYLFESNQCGPKLFTEDVTYEIKLSRFDRDENK